MVKITIQDLGKDNGFKVSQELKKTLKTVNRVILGYKGEVWKAKTRIYTLLIEQRTTFHITGGVNLQKIQKKWLE